MTSIENQASGIPTLALHQGESGMGAKPSSRMKKVVTSLEGQCWVGERCLRVMTKGSTEAHIRMINNDTHEVRFCDGTTAYRSNHSKVKCLRKVKQHSNDTDVDQLTTLFKQSSVSQNLEQKRDDPS